MIISRILAIKSIKITAATAKLRYCRGAGTSGNNKNDFNYKRIHLFLFAVNNVHNFYP